MMKLEDAYVAGGQLCEELEEYCHIIQIAGSVRRERPEVNDIDIVLIPKDDVAKEKIKTICMEKHPAFGFAQAPKSGPALERFFYDEHHVWVDIYYATHETFPLILFVRTGSKEHNIFMCTTAKRKDMYLAADGSGIYADRDKIHSLGVTNEEGIFSALSLAYKAPKDREIEASPA